MVSSRAGQTTLIGEKTVKQVCEGVLGNQALGLKQDLTQYLWKGTYKCKKMVFVQVRSIDR